MVPLRKMTRAAAVSAVVLMIGCGGGRTQVTRLDPDTQTDLSGYWNDRDSRIVADELIDDALTFPWVRQFQQTHQGELPAVIFGAVRNRTNEHIAVNTFLRDMERVFLRSGTARVVADPEQREQIRAEREDQQDNASAATRARMRNELGADFMLVGEITSIEDVEGGQEVVYYQIDLNLTDLESNERVWIGQTRIKKLIERPRRRR